LYFDKALKRIISSNWISGQSSVQKIPFNTKKT